MNGFNIYRGLDTVEYLPCESVPVDEKVSESPNERILNLIFQRDEFGWPCTSVEVMLSEKTSDEVRTFIQNHLMQSGKDIQHITDDPSILHDFDQLSSDFIASCQRNRYESIEDYEKRLDEIIHDDNLKQTIDNFHKRLNDIKHV